MKEIATNIKNRVVLVDDEDFEYLNQFNWYVNKTDYTWYAYRWNKTKHLAMHREIMRTPDEMEVDHKNGKGYDNQKSNMRNCTRSQNSMNKVSPTNHSKGVCYDKHRGSPKKYKAQIKKDGIHYNLGYFLTEIEAAITYNNAATELFGEFALLNNV
jgi:hypothetical protein